MISDGLEEDDENDNKLIETIKTMTSKVNNKIKDNWKLVRLSLLLILLLLYKAYFISVLVYTYENMIELDWCHGPGLLIIITVLFWICFLYSLFKNFFGDTVEESVCIPLSKFINRALANR